MFSSSKVHTQNPSYTSGSQVELPIPKEGAHTFPIIYDSGNLPIIFDHRNGNVEPYTSTTVQALFQTQACIPMTANYEANQWACPNNPSQLWRQSNPVHHVVDDPHTVPLDLAIRLIQVITRSVDPTHNHPEYPYTNKTPELLLNVIPGESSSLCSDNESTAKSITCNSLIPPGHRHNDVNVATEDNCNVIRYDLEKQQCPLEHNALVVLTRRSSLLPENNPGIEPATPNPENSDSSTEIDETEHETSAIPENSPISDTPAPFIDTSQQNPTENPSNPLQRLSRAVGQILTPKTPLSDTAEQNQPPTAEIVPKTPTSRPNAPLPTKRSETHPTFAYPPRQETFFDDDDQDDEQEDDNGPPQIP
ncbi:hypothetical protein MHU86_15738 [Fragilaria crotonensis]|nr:hypothetical protein MHU86_15738 [Fragilaria crotonensis]